MSLSVMSLSVMSSLQSIVVQTSSSSTSTLLTPQFHHLLFHLCQRLYAFTVLVCYVVNFSFFFVSTSYCPMHILFCICYVPPSDPPTTRDQTLLAFTVLIERGAFYSCVACFCPRLGKYAHHLHTAVNPQVGNGG